DAKEHDAGRKSVFRKSGDFDWKDACKLCVSHPQHPSFFVRKLWSYFVPVDPDAATVAGLEALYRTRYEVAPVVRAILMHPALVAGPRMVKPPVVHQAGMLRRLGAGVTTTDWAWIGSLSGQQLFYPPNVAGWDDTRWIDTATYRGRWIGVQRLLRDHQLDPSKAAGSQPADADKLVSGALAFWRNPGLSDGTSYALRRFARAALKDAHGQDWKLKQYPVLIENALRHLIAVSPDAQTSWAASSATSA